MCAKLENNSIFSAEKRIFFCTFLLDYLAVMGILLTHTHTHTHTHTIIARQYIIKHLIYNGLPESIIRGYPCLTTKVPINTHPLPYCLKKGRIFLWSDGTGERSLRPNIVGFLFPPITV